MKTFISDAAATFHTTGDGLRGVPVIVMDRDNGNLIAACVYSNTATDLTLDRALPRNPDRYDAYCLGAIPMAIASGDLTFGAPTQVKHLSHMLFQFERGGSGVLYVDVAADQESQTSTAWQYAGSVPLKGRTYYRLPIEVAGGTGRTIRYQIRAMYPGQLSILTEVTLEFAVRPQH